MSYPNSMPPADAISATIITYLHTATRGSRGKGRGGGTLLHQLPPMVAHCARPTGQQQRMAGRDAGWAGREEVKAGCGDAANVADLSSFTSRVACWRQPNTLSLTHSLPPPGWAGRDAGCTAAGVHPRAARQRQMCAGAWSAGPAHAIFQPCPLVSPGDAGRSAHAADAAMLLHPPCQPALVLGNVHC